MSLAVLPSGRLSTFILSNNLLAAFISRFASDTAAGSGVFFRTVYLTVPDEYPGRQRDDPKWNTNRVHSIGTA
jgi:hypothetical protein